MKTEVKQFPTNNPNPVLSVAKDGTVLYSNEAGEPLLREWGIEVGEKLPSNIGDLVQRVISLNSPERTEIKVGKSVFLVVFSPLPEEERSNIYGFDISDQKKLEEKLRIKEKQNDVLYKIGKIALEFESLQAFMNESVKLIASILELEYCKIMELMPDGNFLLRAGVGWQPEFVGKHVVGGEKESQAGYTLLSRMPVIVEDFEEEDRFNKPEILKIHGVGSGASVIIGSMEKVYGVLVVNSKKKKKFTSEDTYFLNSVAFLIAQTVERNNAVEALREGQERLRFALETSHIGAWDLDLVDHTAHRSLEHDRIFGYEQLLPQWTYEMFIDHVLPEDCAMVDAKFRKATTTGSNWNFECRIRRVDGVVRWIWATGRHQVDATGSVRRMAGIVQDITERKLAEEALRESEERLRLLGDNLPDSAVYQYAHKPDGSVLFLYFSAGIERLNGVSVSDVLRDPGTLHRQIPPEYFKRLVEAEARSAQELSDFDMETPMRLPDGQIRWMRLHSRPRRLHDGRIIWDGVQTDITELKRAEEVLHESESRNKVAEAVDAERRRLFDVLETLPVMICLLTSDHHVAFTNRCFREKFGESDAQHCYEYCFGRTKPCEFCEAFKVFETGQPHNWEVTILDGSVIDVYTLPFTDVDGSPMILKMDIDITERRKAEEKLCESEEKYRNIVETANEIILITNNEEVVTYVNKKIEDILGYTAEEVIGRSVWGFINEEYRPIVKLNLEKRRQGISESYESKLIRKDGSSVWIFLNAKPLFDKDKYIGAMSMLTDITKRKEAEESLAKIETARKKEIHHRIKNNLQVISSLLDLQAEKFKNIGYIQYLEVLEAFRESQDRVRSMSLIHEELYKGEGVDTFDFSSYIKELTENLFLTYKLGNADITLNMDLEDHLFFDMDTAIPLGMIINELVTNSFKHAFPDRDKGEIRIKLSKVENVEFTKSIEENENEDYKSASFALTVSDNGVGIPEKIDIEELESLGLQLVTSLVDQLEGELELKRKNGTEFNMRFIVTKNNNPA
jgi:PAS domain S-box-containing protein